MILQLLQPLPLGTTSTTQPGTDEGGETDNNNPDEGDEFDEEFDDDEDDFIELMETTFYLG